MGETTKKNLLTEILPMEKDAWTFKTPESKKDSNKCVRTMYNALRKLNFVKLANNNIESQNMVINFLRELYREHKDEVKMCNYSKGSTSFFENNSEVLNKKELKACHLNQIRELYEDSLKLKR